MKLIFCLPGQTYSRNWLNCWNRTVRWMHQNNIEYDTSTYYDPIIYACRNHILHGIPDLGKKQQPWQGRFTYDYQIWIDSDMVWTIKDLERLISYPQYDIVSGCYMKQNDTDYALGIADASGTQMIKATREMIDPMADPFPVWLVGFGFVAIKYGVVESLEYPWFRPIVLDEDKFYTFTSEDMGFCHMAREKGFTIWLDPGIQVGHEKSWILRPDIVGGYAPGY